MINYLKSEKITLDGLSKFYANEEEKHDPKACPVSIEKLQEKRGIEIGHIFYLGQKYSKLLDVKVQDKDSKFIYPEMGTYGIGVSRLVGAIIEANHDEKGVIWPDKVAPFFIGIINLKPGDSKCDLVAEDLYQIFSSHTDVLYDDTDDSAGMKFAKMELIGIPWTITIGPRGMQEGKVELKNRSTGDKMELSVESVKHKLLQNFL
jgi:prolyl-tRNA synthetase